MKKLETVQGVRSVVGLRLDVYPKDEVGESLPRLIIKWAFVAVFCLNPWSKEG